MRTTFEIPDDLFKKAKLRAASEGVSLKEVVERALKRELTAPQTTVAFRKARAKRLFAAMDKARNTKPVGPLNRDELYDRPVLRRH